MPSTRSKSVKVHVAIYDEGRVYKHWSLFVEGYKPDDKIIFQVLGSSQNYRFERETSNAHESDSRPEIFTVCSVDLTKIAAIEAAAAKAEIKNQYPGWNCQSYVLDLLDTLVEDGVIEGNDGYKKKRHELFLKQDGLE
ncbi:MAG: hypothetical protein M1825_000859 [Sarcosagium campestre]|nr:MAG: hypothetical protein M1825_000859 [Sarcosagium campestre]